MTTEELSDLTRRAIAAVIDLHDDEAVCRALYAAGLAIYVVKYQNLRDAVDRERMRRAEVCANG